MSGAVSSIPQGSWVAFDFDGTLTRRDSLLPFLRQVLGTPGLMAALAAEAPRLAAYAVKLLSNETAKVGLLRRALGGRRRAELELHGRSFATDGVTQLLRPPLMERLRLHQNLGHRCVLVTASLTLYARPWALAQGFEAVLGSELAFDDAGISDGRLVGGNCYGREKALRLKRLLGEGKLAVAYGDSRGDREMLAMAETAIWRQTFKPIRHPLDQGKP